MAETKKPRACEVRLRVPFHDVDPMRVVWHGHYLKYFEIARDELLRNLGVDLQEYVRETGLAFPIVRSRIKHLRPLVYDDEFFCRATVVEAKRKIIMDFEVRRADDDGVCARGRTEQLAVRYPDMALELSIPDDLRKKLGF